MALSLARWSRLPYIISSRGPTLRMMCRLRLHIIRLAIATIFLMLLINLVSNTVLFAIIYEVLMVLRTMLNKTSSILLTPRSMCCAIGLSTEVELAAHSVNGPFFIRLKKSLGRSPLQNGTGDFSNDTLTYDLVNLL